MDSYEQAREMASRSWEGLEVAFLEFDRATGQIAQDSNLTGRPPAIEP